MNFEILTVIEELRRGATVFLSHLSSGAISGRRTGARARGDTLGNSPRATKAPEQPGNSPDLSPAGDLRS